MNKEQEAQSRRVIVNVLSREHRTMISRRASAAGDLAAETARLSAYEAEARRSGDDLSFSPTSQENRIKPLKEQLDLAEHNAEATALAMEYVALHFVDQIEKAERT